MARRQKEGVNPSTRTIKKRYINITHSNCPNIIDIIWSIVYSKYKKKNDKSADVHFQILVLLTDKSIFI